MKFNIIASLDKSFRYYPYTVYNYFHKLTADNVVIMYQSLQTERD